MTLASLRDALAKATGKTTDTAAKLAAATAARLRAEADLDDDNDHRAAKAFTAAREAEELARARHGLAEKASADAHAAVVAADTAAKRERLGLLLASLKTQASTGAYAPAIKAATAGLKQVRSAVEAARAIEDEAENRQREARFLAGELGLSLPQHHEMQAEYGLNRFMGAVDRAAFPLMRDKIGDLLTNLMRWLTGPKDPREYL